MLISSIAKANFVIPYNLALPVYGYYKAASALSGWASAAPRSSKMNLHTPVLSMT